MKLVLVFFLVTLYFLNSVLLQVTKSTPYSYVDIEMLNDLNTLFDQFDHLGSVLAGLDEFSSVKATVSNIKHRLNLFISSSDTLPVAADGINQPKTTNALSSWVPQNSSGALIVFTPNSITKITETDISFARKDLILFDGSFYDLIRVNDDDGESGRRLIHSSQPSSSKLNRESEWVGVFATLMAVLIPSFALLLFKYQRVVYKLKKQQSLMFESGSNNVLDALSFRNPDQGNGVDSDALLLSSQLKLTSEILGYGSHGTMVFKGYLEDGRQVAVKRMLIDFYEVATREIKLLQESDSHPNVLRYYCRVVDPRFLWIALELATGSLAEAIDGRCLLPDVKRIRSKMDWRGSSEPPRLISADLFTDEKQVQLFNCLRSVNYKTFLLDIVNGVHHLHTLRVVHRDLKPQNILIGSDGRPLIADFGVCKKLSVESSMFNPTLLFRKATRNGDGGSSESSPNSSKEFFEDAAAVGTVGWRPAEVILLDDARSLPPGFESSIKLTKSVDVFSLGCLFYYVLSSVMNPVFEQGMWGCGKGHHPFGSSHYSRESNIVCGKSDLSQITEDPLAFDLVSKMISKDPKQRPSLPAIISHPFFWNATKCMEFISVISERLETHTNRPVEESSIALIESIEASRTQVFQKDWRQRVHSSILRELGTYRLYSGNSLISLLRAIRNKYRHFQELSPPLKNLFGGESPADQPLGYFEYWNDRFPNLLIVLYQVVGISPLAKALEGEYYPPLSK